MTETSTAVRSLVEDLQFVAPPTLVAQRTTSVEDDDADDPFAPGVTLNAFSEFSVARAKDPRFKSIEECRDEVRHWTEQRRPEDRLVPPNQLVARLDSSGRVSLRARAAGPNAADLVLTQHAIRQFAGYVLPGNGLRVLQEFAGMKLKLADGTLRDAGLELVQGMWNVALDQVNDMVKFRVIRGDRDSESGKRPWIVRATVGQNRTSYDDLHVLEALLANPAYRDLPVIQFRRHDEGMLLRLALTNVEGNILGGVQGHEVIDLKKPIPMAEIRHNETGKRALSVTAGGFRLWCLNGAGTWEDDVRRSTRRHVGQIENIDRFLVDNLQAAQISASGICQMYSNALAVRISDITTFLDQQLGGRLSQKELEWVKQARLDPTTTEGDTLATAVDAITLAAHARHRDLYLQARMEAVASTILRDGLTAAGATNRILVARS